MTLPGTPTNQRVVSKNKSTITMAWDAASGTVSGYQLANSVVIVGSTTGLQWKFGGLSCGRTYSLSVWAYNVMGSGSAAVVTATTSPCRSKPRLAVVLSRHRPPRPR
jgi:hypothetical protein